MGVFAVASIRLLPATSQMLNALGRMRESSYALDMLYHDLKEIESHGFRDRLIRRQPLQPISKPVVFHNEIRLQKISYRYPNASSLAINNLSLTLRKGESIAFVGKSGSGKTTLADLLLGLLMPASGDIQVDGRSIYQDLRSWQDLVGYIPQSIFLTDDTIENNIAFGVPAERIDSSRLQAAIQSAQLTDLIDHLPEGVHTRVGERGVRLSGGQRQRIGIARALYHGREVLILDEATSALDTETERQIDDAISSLAGSKTLIIIAHRVSTIEKCDRIYRIEAGTVKQSGTYAEIILSQ
jgi:ABC-type multidrug transport system fused ATPase/permease subunit